jgi:hypothetical protein
MRELITLGIVAISCLIALLATDRIAFAQAGSTGGRIGKTDKSAVEKSRRVNLRREGQRRLKEILTAQA